MKSILITGGNGYIGKSLTNYLEKDYLITAITRKDADLLDSNQVNSFFENKYFDVIIHTAIKGGSRLTVDPLDIVYDNVKMLYNIIKNRLHYSRFINIGSGAEIFASETPYGMSKKIISDIINLHDHHYNLRIFGIFNENELCTRFIKSNIVNYINDREIIVHKNKYMDFFGFKDFVSVLKQYIESHQLPKTFDCCYREKYTLNDIAAIINNLDTKKIPIKVIEEGLGQSYIGESTDLLRIEYEGLEKSILDMFEVLKNTDCNLQ